MASLVAIVRAYWVAITVFTLAAITTLSLYPTGTPTCGARQ